MKTRHGHILLFNFNSIKVRLEHFFGGVDNDQFMVFQFHKGAIRTQERERLIHPLFISIP